MSYDVCWSCHARAEWVVAPGVIRDEVRVKLAPDVTEVGWCGKAPCDPTVGALKYRGPTMRPLVPVDPHGLERDEKGMPTRIFLR